MTAKIPGIIKGIIDVYRDFYDPATARAVADSLLMSDRTGDAFVLLSCPETKFTEEAMASKHHCIRIRSLGMWHKARNSLWNQPILITV